MPQLARVNAFLRRLNAIEDYFEAPENAYFSKIFPQGKKELLLNQPLLESKEKLDAYFTSFLRLDEAEGGTNIKQRVHLFIEELKKEERLGNFAGWLERYQNEFIIQKIEGIAMAPFAAIRDITIAEAFKGLSEAERARKLRDLLNFSTVHFIKDTSYLASAQGFSTVFCYAAVYQGCSYFRRCGTMRISCASCLINV